MNERGCFCENIDFGTYKHTVGMKCPHIKRNDGWVCIDICISQEIAELWYKGVKTLNSCCGHQKLLSSVIVAPESYGTMQTLGYSEGTAQSGLPEFYLNSGTQPSQLENE